MITDTERVPCHMHVERGFQEDCAWCTLPACCPDYNQTTDDDGEEIDCDCLCHVEEE